MNCRIGGMIFVVGNQIGAFGLSTSAENLFMERYMNEHSKHDLRNVHFL